MTSGLIGWQITRFNRGTRPACVPVLFARKHRQRGY
jgi:hypothetical protein